MTIQPYFDEEQLEHILHTDEEDEDDVRGISPERELDVADDDSSGDEIVMLHNHKNRRKQ